MEIVINLIHWKESWKPESSLIYCEKLLQQFWARKSMITHDTLCSSTSITTNSKVNENVNIIGSLEKPIGNILLEQNQESSQSFTTESVPAENLSSNETPQDLQVKFFAVQYR